MYSGEMRYELAALLALAPLAWFAPPSEGAALRPVSPPARRPAATAPRPASPPVTRVPPRPVAETRSETGVGFVAGAIGGIGFGYRWFREDGVGWQVGGLAYADRDDYTVLLGVQRMHTLRLHARSRLYALAGAMHTRDSENYEELVGPRDTSPVYVTRSHDRSSTRFGAGLGMSFGGREGLCAVIELPVVVHFDEDFSFDGIGPIPQVGIIYNY